MDDLHPSYDHLVAADNLADRQQDNTVSNDESKSQEQTQESDQQESQSLNQQEEQLVSQQVQGQEGKQMELDEIANMLVQKGIRGNVNCIVEKRRNEELVDHAPRNVALPFGLNITTPPRLQHLTGEQIVIICKDENEDKESDEKQEEPDMQPIMMPLPPQLLNQIQQVPQMIPLSQVLQHISQQQMQRPQFTQPQVEQQFYVPQHHEQPMFHQGQPQQQVFMPQEAQQQHVFYPQQQHQPQQQVFYPQQQHQTQQQVFYPQQQHQPQQIFYPQQQQLFVPPPPPPQPQQQQPQQPPMMFRPPVPLREVALDAERIPMNHVNHQRMPINPMAVQDVPLRQMPFTHMPMRAEQPVPVHHLVPPRPQNNQLENFSQDDDEPSMTEVRTLEMPEFRSRSMPDFVREMPTPARFRERDGPRPLPLIGREPRLMRLPFAPLADNSLPEAPQPPRRFRFPDSEPETGSIAQITRIIPIRLEKDEESSQEEKRPLPIPINAILDMVFRGIRPLVGRQSMPVPIDIKIERIENKPEIESSSSENSSQESQEDEEPTPMMMVQRQQESTEQPSQTKLQQVEIVEKQGDDTHAIAIPADAQEAQVFKLEKEEFLPNGAGRGGVFQIPEAREAAQIFTVSDARAGVMNDEEEVLPIGVERSIRLFPVDEVEEQTQQQPTESQPPQQAEERTDDDRPHFVQPRSV